LQLQSAAGAAFATDEIGGEQGKAELGGRVWHSLARRGADPSLSLGVNRGVGVVDGREELAGSEGVEGAETGVELRGGQAALAVEPAEKMGRGTLAFEGIAFEAGGDQVAIGVAPGPGAGHDVIEALDARVGAAQTIKTMAALAEVDGLAQSPGLEEVEVFQVGGLRLAGGAADGNGTRHGGQAGAKAANLIRQEHVNDVARFAATDEAERTEGDEATDRFTRGAGADADAAGEPGHGEMELEPAFDTGVADEMRIDGAVGDGEAQLREEKVLELYPKMLEIQFFAFHGGSWEES
jgi:hypothetical protein